jgi:hypothetical protein
MTGFAPGNSQGVPMKTSLLLASGICVACAAPAFAQYSDKTAPAATTVYRQVLPDGRVIYTDEPPKGSKIDRTIKVDPAPKNVAPPAAKTPVPASPSATTAPGALDRAADNVAAAEKALEAARQKQQAGVEPGEGERSGTAMGGSRLNENYQSRQEVLAKEVAKAEESLKAAIRARDAAR